jgi:hypothetical protein
LYARLCSFCGYLPSRRNDYEEEVAGERRVGTMTTRTDFFA